MKLSQFIMLSEGEKTKALMCEGVLVGKQKELPMIRFLFQLDAFYVTMHCDSSSKKVKEFTAFTDTGLLQSFLDEISLNGIV
ncbi:MULTISPECIES: hypothetical protein [Chitinophagaceae]|uniref:hypothetical protein n=1 Tax=Chitinophagaceae TaxID=563835 RepID=UPI000DEFBDB8|nr:MULTISPECIES: hypothetical protein [Chitinophagaceae]RPD47400.1 hypothetical protein DRJ53_11140 [Paracnuella aquatica]